MIRYALACEAGHEFESWFPSSRSYDEQASRGLVECPFCSSRSVEKRLMSPSLGRGAAAPPALAEPVRDGPQDTPAPTSPPRPVAILSEREQALRAMLRTMREQVTRSSDYVGPAFAEEARKMHYGEAEHRSIYGEANPLEAKALMEEGIEFHPLPTIPDDRN